MRIKKLLFVVVVVAVVFTSRIYEVAGWLERYDLVRSAREFERMYLTGSSVAVIVALVILLRGNEGRMIR